MDKYVRVQWPESQSWAYVDGCFGVPFDDGWAQFDVFVPEEMYKANKTN